MERVLGIIPASVDLGVVSVDAPCSAGGCTFNTTVKLYNLANRTVQVDLVVPASDNANTVTVEPAFPLSLPRESLAASAAWLPC